MVRRVIVLISLLAGAGCGSREAPTHASQAAAVRAGSSDPCALVTAQDMGVMFGELRDGPLPSSGLRDQRQCNYTNTAGSWIKLSVDGGGVGRWEWEKGIANAQGPREVGGLGDEAFALRRGTDAVVFVRKGESILELSCSCAAETAEAIARVATTRL